MNPATCCFGLPAVLPYEPNESRPFYQQESFTRHKIYRYLDRAVKQCYLLNMAPRFYTTREVAKRAGISRQTLQAWITEDKVVAPAVIRAAGVRLWTEADLAQVLKVKPRRYPRKPKRTKRR
jgi:MerR HTH family regulatory protein